VGTASATFSARHARARAVIRSALESHFGLDNPDGTRSSLRQATVQVGDKVYSIPTVRNGQILEGPDAIKAAEAVAWGKFPSYANHDEGEARYGQMYDFSWTRTRRPISRSAQARANDAADRQGLGRGGRTTEGHRRRTGRARDAARRCIAGAASSAADADRAGGASGADNRNLS
jgi:hypothetical protein